MRVKRFFDSYSFLVGFAQGALTVLLEPLVDALLMEAVKALKQTHWLSFHFKITHADRATIPKSLFRSRIILFGSILFSHLINNR